MEEDGSANIVSNETKDEGYEDSGIQGGEQSLPHKDGRSTFPNMHAISALLPCPLQNGDPSTTVDSANTIPAQLLRKKPCLLRESRIMVSDISDNSMEIDDSDERNSLHNKPQHRLYIQWAEKQTNQKRVHFSTIQIRRYPMVLGDNPYCSRGPPVSLGWEYDIMPDMGVLHYDRLRSSQRRTNINHLALSSNQRNELLNRIGVSVEERRRVEKEVSRIQRQRTIDCVWKELTGPLETMADSARKVQRVFKRQNARLDDDGSCSTSSTQSLVETRPKKNKRFPFRRQNAF